MTANARCPQLYYYNGWIWACVLMTGHKSGHDFFRRVRRYHTLTSGGWIFKNWHELPHQLQVDIAWAWKDGMDKGILPDGTPLNGKKP